VAGTSFAGRPYEGAVPAGACVRIFTGAAVPAELDAVAIQEHCIASGDAVTVSKAVSSGENVRPAGHDVARGTRLMSAGRRLNPFDLGWLAASGLTDVPVFRRVRLGVFSNGDELVEPGGTLGPGRIFDANRVAVGALLEALPVELRDYGIVPDDRQSIRRVLAQADTECDLVITSGGVSVGEADWVREVVSEIGSLRLWKLNLKPGKPLAYGRLRRAQLFGLPGNPVSTIVTALLLVRPVLMRRCGGQPERPLEIDAVLRGALRHDRGREEFQRGTLRAEGGRLHVQVTGDQSSNRLGSFGAANCLIRIPKERGDVADGETVTVLPFRGLL
jgi:molybdopterin molybdotransferase